jgi:hypothetical protein
MRRWVPHSPVSTQNTTYKMMAIAIMPCLRLHGCLGSIGPASEA